MVNLAAIKIALRFLRHLRENHASTWDELHRPKLIEPENSKASNLLFVFIAFGQFHALEDKMLAADGIRLQLVMAFTLAAIFVMFFLLLGQ